jgi:hypothetical protein
MLHASMDVMTRSSEPMRKMGGAADARPRPFSSRHPADVYRNAATVAAVRFNTRALSSYVAVPITWPVAG